MGSKTKLFEEGYGKGWLYKDLEFIDFVHYHYQVYLNASTTNIRLGQKPSRPRYKLSGNLKFLNYSGSLPNAWYVLRVTKEKGYRIRLEPNNGPMNSYSFEQEKEDEIEVGIPDK